MGNWKILAVSLTLTVFTAAAQKAEKNTKQPPRKASPQKTDLFLKSPFDTGIEALPKNFEGHDCTAIAARLKSLNPEKGEFETTEAYEKRMDISAMPIVGSTSVSDQLAFVVLPQSFNARYNADLKQMDIEHRLMGNNVFFRKNAGDLISTTQKSKEQYTASNAYGKTVTVQKTTYEVCALGFENKTGRPSTVRVTVSDLHPDEARSLKENAGLLYVGKLTKPFYGKYGARLEPKIDSPIEAFWMGDNLIMELNAVWLFDKATGKVYRKDLDVW